jgi:nucleoside-diphosphate-sugar epimerase
MRQAVTGAETVFHLASAHLAVTISEREYWEINRSGSRALVEVSHDSGVARFVHCSSVGVHGEITDPPANEDSPCHPDLVYERSKLEGEKSVRDYAHETGYPVVVLRPTWVYGPGCPRTEKLFRTIKKGRFFFVGNGNALRHCVYITDMIEAFNLCVQNENALGKIFIIGDNKAVTVNELIHQMADVIGASAPRVSLPLWFVGSAFSLVEHTFTLLGKEPPLSGRSLKFFTNNTSFDISRARKEIGFDPKVSLREGLRLTYETMSQTQKAKVKVAA